MSHRLGVDVGGTFTDLLIIEEASGKTYRTKVPSTPHDPSEAVVRGRNNYVQMRPFPQVILIISFMGQRWPPMPFWKARAAGSG